MKVRGLRRQCPSLAHLVLTGNQIGDEGAVSLAVVLGRRRQPGTSLTHLYLAATQLEMNGRGSVRRCSGVAHHLPIWSLEAPRLWRRRRSLLRIVHARGAIPNEMGPTRCLARLKSVLG